MKVRATEVSARMYPESIVGGREGGDLTVNHSLVLEYGVKMNIWSTHIQTPVRVFPSHSLGSMVSNLDII